MNALSTYEFEYITNSLASCQAILIGSILKELEMEDSKPMILIFGQQIYDWFGKNHVLHARSKHIEEMLHFLREQDDKKVLNVVHCPTQKQLVDYSHKLSNLIPL